MRLILLLGAGMVALVALVALLAGFAPLGRQVLAQKNGPAAEAPTLNR